MNGCVDGLLAVCLNAWMSVGRQVGRYVCMYVCVYDAKTKACPTQD